MTRLAAALARTDIRIPGIDLPLMSVSQTRGVVRRSELTDKPARAESLDVYKVVRKGEIAFNKMSIRAGALGVAPEDGLVTYHYEVMRPRPGHDGRFLVYLMKSEWFISELVRRERGIGAGEQANVRTTEVPFKVLKTIDVWLPPRAEQRAVADFLDRENAKIDALIEKQNVLIGLLKERVAAVITREACPVDAPVVSLGLVTRGIKDGTHGTFERVSEDEGLPLFSAKNVSGGELVQHEAESYISAQDHAAIVASGFPRHGDVMLVIIGATIGKSAVYRRRQVAAFQRSVAFLRPGPDLDSDFLWYQTMSRPFKDELALRTKTAAQPGIYLGEVASIRVTMPPLQEQRAITRRLDNETAKVHALIAKAEEHIALARERRAALITAAVTGQVDVGGGD